MKAFRILGNFMIVLLMGAACASAETPAAKPAPEASPRLALYQSEAQSGKTAYVDMAELFNKYSGTNSALDVLRKEMEQKMPERQALSVELERLAKEGGDSEAIKAQRKKIQLYDQQVQAAMDLRQTEVLTPIFETLETAVKKFGAGNGYQAIYAEPREGADDVTEAVLKDLK